MSDEEYERQQKALAEKLERELDAHEQLLLKSESELAELQEQIDIMEKKANDVKKRMDTLDVINAYILQQMQLK